jgi:hypothetical protein
VAKAAESVLVGTVAGAPNKKPPEVFTKGNDGVDATADEAEVEVEVEDPAPNTDPVLVLPNEKPPEG